MGSKRYALTKIVKQLKHTQPRTAINEDKKMFNVAIATDELRTLKLSTGSFDQENTFPVFSKRGFPMIASLHQDYEKEGDGIYWAMKHGACLKSSYTDADRAETARLSREPVLLNGEIVLIDGKQYQTRILGNYSNCAVFDAI